MKQQPLNIFKSAGPRLLKELAEELYESLTLIFNKFWNTEEVWEDWKS